MSHITASSIQDKFRHADENKKIIDAARPLTQLQIKQLEDYFKIGVTFSSNAIEGNTLTITETKVLLEDGLTVGGKPVKDYYEASGHGDAYDFMMSTAKASPFKLDHATIKKLHQLFYVRVKLESAGVYRHMQVFITGTEYFPPRGEEVEARMTTFIEQGLDSLLHPIEQAARLHKGLVDIHPFEDGNGRTARLLMNLVLVNAGYGVAIIPPVLRGEYIEALRISQREKNPSDLPFISLLTDCVLETQRDYGRLLRIQLPKKERTAPALSL